MSSVKEVVDPCPTIVVRLKANKSVDRRLNERVTHEPQIGPSHYHDAGKPDRCRRSEYPCYRLAQRWP